MAEVESEPKSSGLYPDTLPTTLGFFHGFDCTAISNDEKIKNKTFVSLTLSLFKEKVNMG